MQLIELKILDPRAVPPQAATELSAGFDLRAIIDAPIVLLPGAAPTLIGTGFALNMGAGKAAMLLPRSGLGHREGLVLGNLVGLIDGDYQGELFMSAWNRSAIPITVNPLDRIAQMVIVPVLQVGFAVVSEFSVTTARQDGGFGSTGSS